MKTTNFSSASVSSCKKSDTFSSMLFNKTNLEIIVEELERTLENFHIGFLDDIFNIKAALQTIKSRKKKYKTLKPRRIKRKIKKNKKNKKK